VSDPRSLINHILNVTPDLIGGGNDSVSDSLSLIIISLTSPSI